MTELELHLRIAGWAVIAIGLAHVGLPRALGWHVELATASLLTRQIAHVHSAYIGLTCVLLGALPALAPGLLTTSGALGLWVLGGLIAFWGSRLIVQLAVYDARLWRGNGPRTAVHVAATLLWAYETFVYALAFAAQLD